MGDPPDVERAKTVIRTARTRSRAIKGTKEQHQRLRDHYDEIANGVEAAVELCNGGNKDRSNSWRGRLPDIVDRAIEQMNELPIPKAIFKGTAREED